jgi:predicted lysophospholipase L1 biosynthesis ABC-type transport system permease subunit
LFPTKREAPVPAEGSFSRTALRIAWRELRASPAKFAFVVFAVTAGVGALTGVRAPSWLRTFR